MSNENIVSTIENTLKKKKNLEDQIAVRVKFIGIDEKTYIQPKGYGQQVSFYVERSHIIPIVKKEVESLEQELDAINAKLSAIGALMGVSE